MKYKKFIILAAEAIFISLMVLGIFPREASLVITGILIFYFIFSPLEDSLWVFIVSIPLFVALPITESFDSMANWRLLSLILFCVFFFKYYWKAYFQNKLHIHRPNRTESLALIFLLIACLSLLAADNLWVGIKKILFLLNMLFLYIVVKGLAVRKPPLVHQIIKAMKAAAGIVLALGYVQLIAVCFVPLYSFWQFWAKRVIPVFYGQNLGKLLSYSNAWFSYYSYQLPTLRMFSIFPDSHSFAFFCILALPLFLSLIFLRSRKQKFGLFAFYFFLVLCLLGILFSGSRGAWASALGLLLLSAFSVVLFFTAKVRFWLHIPSFRSNSQWSKKNQLILGTLILFFLLLPISSGILLLSQKAQMGRIEDIEKTSFLERFKSITDFSELSAKSRLEIWRRTIDSIAKYPLLGVGIGNYPLILNEDIEAGKKGASAHNLYLDFASETGVFGLIVLIVIFWQIFKRAWLVLKEQTEPSGSANLYFKTWAGFFLLALLWILIYSLFDVVLLNDKVFLFFTVNVALLYVPQSTTGNHKHSNLQRRKSSL